MSCFRAPVKRRWQFAFDISDGCSVICIWFWCDSFNRRKSRFFAVSEMGCKPVCNISKRKFGEAKGFLEIAPTIWLTQMRAGGFSGFLPNPCGEVTLSRLGRVAGTSRRAVAPSAIGFGGTGLGSQHAGDLFVGAARTFLDEGYLFEFQFDNSRQHFAFSDPRLADKVDDNDYKFDEGESASLVAGKNFGIVTNIVTGPDGNLYVTPLSNGAVYMITNTNPTPAAPLPKVLVNSLAQLEGKSGLTPFTFSVKLPEGGSRNGPVTYDVFTTDGTAKAGVNYLAIIAGDVAHGGTVTFAQGSVSATVTVFVIAGSIPVTPATANGAGIRPRPLRWPG
jgi:hypothetical protein